MASEGSLARVAQLLMAIIDYSLDHFFYRNAIFWSERLVALDTTSAHFVYYRALSFFRAGQVGRAYDALMQAPPFFALPTPLPRSSTASSTRPTASNAAQAPNDAFSPFRGGAPTSTSAAGMGQSLDETSHITELLDRINSDPSCQFLLARCCFDLGNLAEGITAANRLVFLLELQTGAHAAPIRRPGIDAEVPTISLSSFDDGEAWRCADLYSDTMLEDLGDLEWEAFNGLSLGQEWPKSLQSIAAFLSKVKKQNAKSLLPYLQRSPASRHDVDFGAAYALLGLLEKDGDVSEEQSMIHLHQALDQNPFLFNAMEGLLQQGYDQKLDSLLPSFANGFTDFPRTSSQMTDPTPTVQPTTPFTPVPVPSTNAGDADTRVDEHKFEPIPNLYPSGRTASYPFHAIQQRPQPQRHTAEDSALLRKVRPAAKENEPALPNQRHDIILTGEEDTLVPPPNIVQKRLNRTLKSDAVARKRQRSDDMQVSQPDDDNPDTSPDDAEEMQEEIPCAQRFTLSYSQNLAEEKRMARPPFLERMVSGADHAFAWTAHLMRTISVGLQHSHQFRATDAERAFQRLSPSQYETAWVHAILGSTHAECQRWNYAVRHFQHARRLDRLQQEQMDIFSTALWQTGNKVQLSHLAHELIEANRRSPVAWVALGNAFSLQKEHETALKCFQRAIQLDPTYAYAYSLAGHEHLANDDYEKSLATFRNAIKWNSRLYNAWYGLALVYSQQEKLEMAEYHYTQALLINSRSATLYQNLAGIAHRLNKTEKALSLYNHAILYSEEPMHAMYRKAKVLIEKGSGMQAIELLELVRAKAANDPKVYEALGEAYEAVGKPEAAIDSYMFAIEKAQKEKPRLLERVRRLQRARKGGDNRSTNTPNHHDEDTSMWALDANP